MSSGNDWEAGGMYHACRWCKHYIKGCCTLGVFKPVHSTDVYKVADEGDLSGVIEETLNSSKPEKLMKAMDNLLAQCKVSKAKRAEARNLFEEHLLAYNDFELKERLDEAISKLYQDRLSNDTVKEEVEIVDPERFYCSRWE